MVCEVCTGTMDIVLVGDVGRDSLKVSIVGCDSLKSHSSPLDVELSAPELSVFRTFRCREVDREEQRSFFNPRSDVGVNAEGK